MKCSNVQSPGCYQQPARRHNSAFGRQSFCQRGAERKALALGTDVVAAPAFSEDFVKRVQASAGKTGRLVLLTDYNLGAGELTGLEASTELSSRLGMNVPTVLLTAVAGDLIEAD